MKQNDSFLGGRNQYNNNCFAMFLIFIKILFCLTLDLGVVQGAPRVDSGNKNKQTVCYDHLRCFSNLPPFQANMPLPMSPQEIQTEYYLRTRQNIHHDQPIEPTSANLTSSYFDPLKPTKILIHGFKFAGTELEEWVPEVAETILYQEDVNTIQINWVKGAAVKYDNAVSNTRLVGRQVAHLIKMLMEVTNAKAKDFHLVGFSLGAHAAGFAGKMVQKGGKRRLLGRITGLDPANPGFNYDDPIVRLDKTDAKFVDVIHTDTSTFLAMSLGMNRNLGHVDFFPNGGMDQTGCNSWSGSSGFMSAVADSASCDHTRAPELFKASINATGIEPHMTAYKCDSFEKFKRGVCLRCSKKSGKNNGGNQCKRMGYWATPPKGKKSQQYYLVTSGKAPFIAKHFQVQIHWRKTTDSTLEGFKAKLYVTLHGNKGSLPEIELNDGATFHVVAGRTTRFLVTQDTMKDVGDIERVTIRWERPSCWAWFFCSSENINLKRIKIFDAENQQRLAYLPLGKNRDQRIRSHEILPGTVFELLHTSYIRSHIPRRYKTLAKEEARIEEHLQKASFISKIESKTVSSHKKSTVENNINFEDE